MLTYWFLAQRLSSLPFLFETLLPWSVWNHVEKHTSRPEVLLVACCAHYTLVLKQKRIICKCTHLQPCHSYKALFTGAHKEAAVFESSLYSARRSRPVTKGLRAAHVPWAYFCCTVNRVSLVVLWHCACTAAILRGSSFFFINITDRKERTRNCLDVCMHMSVLQL